MFGTRLHALARVFVIAVFAAGGLFAAANRHSVAQPLAAPTARADDALDGRWEVVELTRGDVAGKILPSEDVTGIIVFTGDRFRFTLESFQFSDPQASATVTLDASQTPKQMDLTFTAGPDAGKTAKGVYELAGDTLKICVPAAAPFDDRPTDFTVPEGSTRMLFVLRKER
jgi:uncharacterized protein (TIGR03067 family)